MTHQAPPRRPSPPVEETLPFPGIAAKPDDDDESIACAATLCVESLARVEASAIPSRATSTARTTVLPRVDLHEAQPRLVRQDRTRYEPVRLLGAGGVGEVLQARDNDIDRLVAVKRLLPDMQAAPILVRFMQEIRTIGMLEHPNIIPIHDVGVDERGEYYFVMKYVQGETLEGIIEKLAAGDPAYHRRFPFERRLELFEGVLEAMHYAHANGVVHRDIKPANIMVGPYGEVMVMDWGIARRLDAVTPDLALETGEPSPASAQTSRATGLFKTRVGSVIGTPLYMSPEQARGEPVDARSDLYSLCVMLDELLTLRHYLGDRKTIEEVLEGVVHHRAPMAGRVRNPHQPVVPMDLSWFLRKGLQKVPADRYQSAAEMLTRLQLRRQGRVPIQCHITFMKRVSGEWTRIIDRHPMAITLTMAATVALAVGLTWHLAR